jgi:tetratricopeptide (TPR) repeat protein
MMSSYINIHIILIIVFAMQATYARDFPQTRDANIEEMPFSPQTALQAGRKAVDAKDWQTAIGHFEKAVLLEPTNADGFNLLAYSLRKQTTPNLPKAFENYRIALKLDPKHKGAHEYIGETYLIVGKPDEAKKHLVILEKLCGNKTCEEYEDLAKAIDNYKK